MAVDVAQIIVKRMNALDYKVASVKIGSEAIKSQDGNTRNVSTIEVAVSRYLLICFIFKLSLTIKNNYKISF